jgi:hypothetical protein
MRFECLTDGSLRWVGTNRCLDVRSSGTGKGTLRHNPLSNISSVKVTHCCGVYIHPHIYTFHIFTPHSQLSEAEHTMLAASASAARVRTGSSRTKKCVSWLAGAALVTHHCHLFQQWPVCEARIMHCLLLASPVHVLLLLLCS